MVESWPQCGCSHSSHLKLIGFMLLTPPPLMQSQNGCLTMVPSADEIKTPLNADG